MKQIVVNTDSMRAAHKTCKAQVETLRTALGEMQASVEALNDTWEGGNHDDFDAAFKTRYAAMEKLVVSIDEYLKAFNTASDSYEACESETLSLASF